MGLAEGFQPSVKVSCVGGTMKIRVDTLTPFQGIIHGPNRTEPGCSVMGKSGLKTYLNIDLTRPEGALVNISPIQLIQKSGWSTPNQFCRTKHLVGHYFDSPLQKPLSARKYQLIKLPVGCTLLFRDLKLNNTNLI